MKKGKNCKLVFSEKERSITKLFYNANVQKFQLKM